MRKNHPTSPKENSLPAAQETPIEEAMKYLHLRNYLLDAKKIREAWNASKGESQF